jgi:hypothetical protein
MLATQPPGTHRGLGAVAQSDAFRQCVHREHLGQEVRQGTFVRRQWTEEPVTYWHKKEQVFKTLDVQRNAWTPVAAHYFEAVESLGLA